MSPTVMPAAGNHRLHGNHVLGICLAFFGAIFLVNGAMIYAALSTNTGVVASEPYRKGLHYNERIAADERQYRLGWSETLSVARDGRITFTLAQPDGRPIAGLRVVGMLGRPVTNRHDITLTLREVAPGRYAAQTAPLDAGNWAITLQASADDAKVALYRTRKRLWLTP